MSSRRTRPILAIAALTTLLVTVFGTASAYGAWNIGGTGSGATSADSLVTPTVSAAKSTTTPSTAIRVTWTATGQLPGATYTVKRGTTTLSCTTSPCDDTGLTPGTTYNYSVIANLGANWTSIAGTASASTDANAATKFAVAGPGTVTAGVSGTVTITAQRADNSTDTSYTGTKTISWSGTASANSPSGAPPTLPTAVTFTNGVATINSIVLTRAGANLTLTATDGTLAGSATATVDAATATRLGFWQAAVTKSGATTTYDCIFSCVYDNLGNNGSITSKVAIFDAYGNTPANRTSDLTVTVARSGSQTGSSTVTIPTGATISAGTVSASGATASYSITLTASATGFTSGTASISK